MSAPLIVRKVSGQSTLRGIITTFAVRGTLAEGANYPTAASSVGGTGAAWSNPTNVFTPNGEYAVQTPTTIAANNDYIYAQDFDFGTLIQDTDIVVGVVVEFTRFINAGFVLDDTIQLLVNGTPSGDNNAADTGLAWATTIGTVAAGGIADSWGLSLTGADVKDPDFGVCLRCNSLITPQIASIDNIRMTVYYTAASPPAGTTVHRLMMMGCGI